MELAKRLLAPHRPVAISQPSLSFIESIARLRSKAAARKFSDELKQFADVTSAFGVLLANGLPVAVAIRWLEPRLSDTWQENFALLIENLDLGADLVEELEAFHQRIPLPEVGEFTQKLQVSIERGTPIAQQVSQLSQSIQQQVMRGLIRRAGQNETKMLIPTIFLILPVTVLFAIYPSLAVLQSTY
jgi:tight adherence protein C